jgi:hypothetical protein
MTTNQQQIVNSLIAEFNRIEAEHKPKTTFNLINLDALNDKTNEIARYKAEEKANLESWDKMANDEARRLVKLFQEDLPTASVQKYGKENYHYDLPSVLIRRNENTSTHHESCVSVQVFVVKVNDVADSFGNRYERGVQLKYRFSYGCDSFNSIEELVSNKLFLEELRLKVL